MASIDKRFNDLERAINPGEAEVTVIEIYYGDEPAYRVTIPGEKREFWNPETQEWLLEKLREDVGVSPDDWDEGD